MRTTTLLLTILGLGLLAAGCDDGTTETTDDLGDATCKCTCVRVNQSNPNCASTVVTSSTDQGCNELCQNACSMA